MSAPREERGAGTNDAVTRDVGAELALMDGIARGFLARVGTIRFGVARYAAERDAVYRRRYAAVIARGWGTPDAFPDGRERDAGDERAVHVVGWDGTTLAVTARLIFPAPGRRLPAGELFGLEVEPVGQVVNVDRLIVAAAYSKRRHRLLLGLLGQIWLTARAGGCHVWVGIDTAGMVRLYRILGFQGTAPPPPRP